jgi:uncharacterized protein (TIGR03067 family)
MPIASACADDRAELKALQGKWKAVACEAGGEAFPKESLPDFSMVIGADGKTTCRTPDGEYQVVLTINSTKNPKTLDTLHESGPEKGKHQYGVYKLEGDKFTVCVTHSDLAESDRPKEFATKDTMNVLFVFERMKEEGKP